MSEIARRKLMAALDRAMQSVGAAPKKRAGVKYDQAFDGQWIFPEQRGWKMACCDCGLVHTVDFAIKHNRVLLRATRDNRATGQRRRKLKREEGK